MNDRENLLRAWQFQRPEWIPVATGLPWLDWPAFGYDIGELESICLKHPKLFPGFQRGQLTKNHEAVFATRPDLIAGKPYTDFWGCVWETIHTGMVGAVRQHPFSDWSRLDGFRGPDPDRTDGLLPLNWDTLRKARTHARAEASIFGCYLPHGHTFLRLQDLCGYERLLCEMAEETPELRRLVAIVEEFNLQLIHRFLALEPDFIGIPEDLGMQSGPMLSPDMFREFIRPVYRTLTAPIKARQIPIHEHSDGHVLAFIDDLIESGGTVLNLQDLVNGIDNLAALVKGRAALDLDIDRQEITVHGSPADIDDHIRECVMKLSTPRGGLSMCYQPWPPTPARNMDAVFTALEKYSVYYG